MGGNGYEVNSAGKDNAAITLGTGSLKRNEEINSGGFSNVTIAGTADDEFINISGVLIAEGDIAAIHAGAGDDRIFAASGDDILAGGTGNDYLDGGVGSDTSNSNNGDDTIIAGLGNDFPFGDAGNDVFLVTGSIGFDAFNGGTGIDTIRAGDNGAQIGIARITGVEINLAGGFSNFSIVGSIHTDVLDFTGIQLIGLKSISTGSGDDNITGSGGADTILGLIGNDTDRRRYDHRIWGRRSARFYQYGRSFSGNLCLCQQPPDRQSGRRRCIEGVFLYTDL
jgi:Ca2+-binding RTX toxin-like protein